MEKKRLRAGYTTGTCAQAATKAAVWMLLSGEEKTSVDVVLPKGKELTLLVCEIEMKRQGEKIERVSCAVRKDSGDDPDITNSIFVLSLIHIYYADGGESKKNPRSQTPEDSWRERGTSGNYRRD